MKVLITILWIILFPLATTINEYFLTKTNKMRGEELSSKEQRDSLHSFEFGVFIVVLLLLISNLNE